MRAGAWRRCGAERRTAGDRVEKFLDWSYQSPFRVCWPLAQPHFTFPDPNYITKFLEILTLCLSFSRLKNQCRKNENCSKKECYKCHFIVLIVPHSPESPTRIVFTNIYFIRAFPFLKKVNKLHIPNICGNNIWKLLLLVMDRHPNSDFFQVLPSQNGFKASGGTRLIFIFCQIWWFLKSFAAPSVCSTLISHQIWQKFGKTIK